MFSAKRIFTIAGLLCALCLSATAAKQKKTDSPAAERAKARRLASRRPTATHAGGAKTKLPRHVPVNALEMRSPQGSKGDSLDKQLSKIESQRIVSDARPARRVSPTLAPPKAQTGGPQKNAPINFSGANPKATTAVRGSRSAGRRPSLGSSKMGSNRW